ncbi:MAG: cytidylate kinase-like family protein [Ruminococcaceae bacterium]|nr:cytidylate kinase-like family protein [Oscillospiraceae bacterium]
MRIITISREFGSGGRELGKRLADALGIPCYDQQIIELVAEKEKLDKNYVASRSEKEISAFYPTTIARGFYSPGYMMMQTVQIMSSEHDIIRQLAKEGDCVIVGRAADVILEEYNPFRIFVCADDASKIARCKARAEADEKLEDKEILRKCHTIDKRRASYRRMLTDKKWGSAAASDLCINTSNREIKSLLPAILNYIEAWYAEAEEK